MKNAGTSANVKRFSKALKHSVQENLNFTCEPDTATLFHKLLKNRANASVPTEDFMILMASVVTN